VGFKDVIPTFKGEKFDPEHLMDLYQKAGAKYFSAWACTTTTSTCGIPSTRGWNAANMGPKKDVVGLFRQAALKRGMKFGVSEHLWISYKWFGVSHDSDKTASTPASATTATIPRTSTCITTCRKIIRRRFRGTPRASPTRGSATGSTVSRTCGQLPARYPVHRRAAAVRGIRPQPGGARCTNESARAGTAGKVEAVYNSKLKEDCAEGTCVLDFRARLADAIAPNPWQMTDTCVGNWHTSATSSNKTPKTGDRHAVIS